MYVRDLMAREVATLEAADRLEGDLYTLVE